MKKCFIHIGWHKTGSTSIQRFLHSNQAKLAQQNWFYPDNEPFRYMFSAFFERHDKYFYGDYFSPPHVRFDSTSRKRDAFEKIKNSIHQAKGMNLIISAEDLCLMDQNEIVSLKNLLKAHYQKIIIFAYIRDHAEFSISALQQKIKMGFELQSICDSELDRDNSTTNIVTLGMFPLYRERLRLWKQHFKSDFVLRPFHDFRDDPTKVYECLAREMNIDISSFKVPANRNVGVSRKSLAILDQLNQRNHLLINGEPNLGFVLNLQHYAKRVEGPVLDRIPSIVRDKFITEKTKDALFLQQYLQDSQLSRFNETPDNLFSRSKELFDCYNLDIEVLNLIFQVAKEKQNSTAREKLFGALLDIEMTHSNNRSVSVIHDSLFLMTEPSLLSSSSNWLKKANQLYLAQLFEQKADKVSSQL